MSWQVINVEAKEARHKIGTPASNLREVDILLPIWMRKLLLVNEDGDMVVREFKVYQLNDEAVVPDLIEGFFHLIRFSEMS